MGNVKLLLARRLRRVASVPSAQIVTGTAGGQLVLVAATPVLTRLYSPDDFGILAAYTALMSILTVAAALRLELALPTEERDSGANALLGLAALIILATSGAVAMFALLLRYSGINPFGAFIWMVPVGTLGGGAYAVASHLALREQRYKVVAQTMFAQRLAQALTQVAVGLFWFGPLGLLLGQVIGQSGGTLTLLRSRGAGVRPAFRMQALKEVAQKHRRFIVWSTPSGLVNRAGLAAPYLAIAVAYGPVPAGLLGLAARIVDVPTQLVGQAMQHVFVGQASAVIRSGAPGMRPIVARNVATAFCLAAVPFAIAGVAAPPAFEWIFGDEWREAGQYVRALLPMFILRFAMLPVGETLNLVGRQQQQLSWDVGRLLLAIAAFAVSLTSRSGVLHALLLYALAMATAYACYIMFALRAASNWDRLTEQSAARQ
jgi:O-antigen/teichoic acid export membrane protein